MFTTRTSAGTQGGLFHMVGTATPYAAPNGEPGVEFMMRSAVTMNSQKTD